MPVFADMVSNQSLRQVSRAGLPDFVLAFLAGFCLQYRLAVDSQEADIKGVGL
jgi:hypothetical protein